MEPYYDDGTCVIYHADCREFIPLDGRFDAVFTSPPYNLGLISGAYAKSVNAYASHDDTMPDSDYVEWQQSIIGGLWDLLPEHGAIFYNHKPLIRDGTAMLPTRLLPPCVTVRQVITWDRGVGMNWSPSHFVPRCEWVLVLARRGFRLVDRGASNAGDVWRIPIEQSAEGHPCAFPVALPMNAMMATDSAWTWLDPFMGSGTTLRAAKDLGRKAIGIEIEERYCEIAAQRLAQEVLAF